MELKKILIVEDDQALAKIIRLTLQKQKYVVSNAYDGVEALALFNSYQPDLVLLDVMLPKLNGIQVCQAIRKKSNVAIIMLSALADVNNTIKGLESGADDYIAKPFSRQVLVAKIKARFRQNELNIKFSQPVELISLGNLLIDANKNEVKKNGIEIRLTPYEFQLLYTLARSPWKTFSRKELLKHIWGYENEQDTKLLSVHIRRLRKKIEDDESNPTLIITVRNVGYRAKGTNS